MNNLSTSVNSVEWRRNKVQELASQGYNQSEISRILQISQPTINRDITYLRQQAKENIRRYIDERLPEEYEKCLVGLTAITKEAWNTAANTEDKRERLQALSLLHLLYQDMVDSHYYYLLIPHAVISLDFVAKDSQMNFRHKIFYEKYCLLEWNCSSRAH